MKIKVYNNQKVIQIPNETKKLIESAAKLCLKKRYYPSMQN